MLLLMHVMVIGCKCAACSRLISSGMAWSWQRRGARMPLVATLLLTLLQLTPASVVSRTRTLLLTKHGRQICYATGSVTYLNLASIPLCCYSLQQQRCSQALRQYPTHKSSLCQFPLAVIFFVRGNWRRSCAGRPHPIHAQLSPIIHHP